MTDNNYTEGWNAALVCLQKEIMEQISHFQEAMNEPDIHPELLKELLHAQNGIFTAHMMAKKLQK
jgi:hypothetical protein